MLGDDIEADVLDAHKATAGSMLWIGTFLTPRGRGSVRATRGWMKTVDFYPDSPPK
jgi:hypothetical protein